MSTDLRVYIDAEAAPLGPAYLLWPTSFDDLVRFVYANQGPLFTEDAVLFRTWTPERGEHLFIRRDVGIRIMGSWETNSIASQLEEMADALDHRPRTIPMPTNPTPTVTVTGYWLTAEDVQTIATALYDNEDRQQAQQEASHDYTPDDLRDATRRRTAVRRALHLEDTP